ncbi:helix-turn-helix domain-containing protein [Agrobacterium rhizogenes]|uniref:S24 family peptidase n=1 Tax=Rhizobium rhizogenes TaxID=359 RepID=UPI0015733B0D|nr:S24 family peptidase [Rhizobium rhizogenes]NTG48997.1 helix-turn-helix domain-containing protein [Rhizobium rhizogenes]
MAKEKSTNEAIGERIRYLREDVLSISQEEFARRLGGVTRGAIGNWELGKGIKLENVQKISLAFGASFEWLATSRGRAPDQGLDARDPVDPDPIAPNDAPMSFGAVTGARNIPEGHSAQIDVTGGMGAGGLTTVVENVSMGNGLTFAADHVRDHWRLPLEVLSSLALKAEHIAIIPVQGDSMLPTLNEGDFVFIDTRHRLPSPDGIYAIADSFGGIVVKRLEVIPPQKEDDEVQVTIISDNSDRHTSRTWRLSDLHIIGRVVRRFGVVR